MARGNSDDHLACATPNDKGTIARTRALNAAQPVFRLSTEMLLEVFRTYRAMLSRPPDQGTLRWIVVTHVCARWRNVALRAPVLWRDILLTERTIDLLDELLSRAGYTGSGKGSITLDIFHKPEACTASPCSDRMLQAYNTLTLSPSRPRRAHFNSASCNYGCHHVLRLA